MRKNMGAADRWIRLLIAVTIAGLYATGVISGTVAVVLLVLAAVFAATSASGFCPLYAPLGVSTRGGTADSDEPGD